MANRWISKSKYLAGLQCPKLLWTHYNAKDQIPEPGAATQLAFGQGHEVGRLAQSLFPGGTEVAWGDDFDTMLRASRELLTARRPIYEATFAAAGAFARADILQPSDDGGWDLVEVKSSTTVKPVHVEDVALQRFCYEAAGVPIRRCHLMHINNQYVRRGAVDASGLLMAEDITESVTGVLPTVGARVADMQRVIGLETCPEVEVGGHCDEPYICPLKDVCWAERWKAEAASGEPTGEWDHSPEELRAFLGSLSYPLHLLDFETFQTAIPLFDECRPYNQVPFQFSLHVLAHPDAEPVHHGWLWDGTGDPRSTMLAELRDLIGPEGAVMAYNDRFERSRLEESARAFHEHATWVSSLLPRFVDLGQPFRSRVMRHPSLGRSWSLKRVLPLLTDLGYDDLAIGDGGTASAEFMRVMFTPEGAVDRERVRAELDAYCAMDTYAMVAILNRLKETASGSE